MHETLVLPKSHICQELHQLLLVTSGMVYGRVRVYSRKQHIYELFRIFLLPPFQYMLPVIFLEVKHSKINNKTR
jgi:hypothetical protein